MLRPYTDVVSTSQRLDDGQFARWWAETGEWELCQILYWKWDPIRVSEYFPDSAHEYDSYADEIIAAVGDGASIAKISETLVIIEDERMGLGKGPSDRRHTVAADILAWFESSQNRWMEFGPLRR